MTNLAIEGDRPVPPPPNSDIDHLDSTDDLDTATDVDIAVPASRRRWSRLRDADLWMAVGAITVAAIIAVGILYLLWLVLTTGAHLLTVGGSWLATGPLARAVTGPVHAYLHAHDAGLPASTGQLWWAWLATAAVLWAAAVFGHSRGARIGWSLLGAASVAMVWAGAAPHSRDLAAGIAVAAWSLLSIPAFTPDSRPDRTVVLGGRAAADSPASSAATAPASVPAVRRDWAPAVVVPTPGARLQWGVLIDTPSGGCFCTAARDQYRATTAARTANRARPGSAHLIYREVCGTGWSEQLDGVEFGVRYTWPDGHIEYRPAEDRTDAEYLVRTCRNDGVTARAVSQLAVYGDWLTATAEAVDRL